MSKRGHLEYLAELVHDYFGVNMDILWDVLTTKLPALFGQIDGILKDTK